MRRFLVLALVVGCGGTSRPPETAKPVPADVVATPDPAPTPTTTTEPPKPVEQVAIGGTGDDPCDGGEVHADPCAGGEATGSGGLGLRGTGEGGAGVGRGPGLGSGGTIGSGSGSGRGGGGPPGSRSSGVPKVALGKLEVIGKLDAQKIRVVVMRHTSQLRYCYETLLTKNPDLAGKLTITFVIGPEGHVAQAKGTGVTPDLETCVAGRVITWEFPKPKSGIVKVSYPVVFAPSS